MIKKNTLGFHQLVLRLKSGTKKKKKSCQLLIKFLTGAVCYRSCGLDSWLITSVLWVEFYLKILHACCLDIQLNGKTKSSLDEGNSKNLLLKMAKEVLQTETNDRRWTLKGSERKNNGKSTNISTCNRHSRLFPSGF